MNIYAHCFPTHYTESKSVWHTLYDIQLGEVLLSKLMMTCGTPEGVCSSDAADMSVYIRDLSPYEPVSILNRCPEVKCWQLKWFNWHIIWSVTICLKDA